MTSTASPRTAADTPPRVPSRARRVVARTLRWIGTTLSLGSVLVLLYAVYLVWFTSLETDRAQRELIEVFVPAEVEEPVAAVEPASAPEPGPEVTIGEAYAALWFERSGLRIVHEDTLIVVEGATVASLKRGPGRYEGSDVAGGDGNLSIAGHRTTFGAPFQHLDELQDGDTIHVLDHEGVEWVYGYTAQRIVGPDDAWVIGPDPLGTGQPMITLTTCHPRFSAAQRLIVWGELLGTARRE